MRRWAAPALLLTSLGLAACHRDDGGVAGGGGVNRVRLVFIHQPLWGEAAPFDTLLAEFRRDHPEVELTTQLLPNASDVAHQFFLTALEGRSTDFDVLVVDVIWVAEFARAGWILDLSPEVPPEELRRDFLPGPAEAVVVDGKTYAVPWYVDVGLLYYRTDLIPRAPRTYAELEAAAARAMRLEPGIQGYVWQGRQYEGLVCNAYEAIWGHGGESLEDGRLLLDTAPARDALGYLRGLIEKGLSPRAVTSATEEESRRAFQSGRAALMRNWPYAWDEAQAEGSPIRGKVAFTALPTVTGEPGSGALGGWQLAVNAYAPPSHRAAAVALIRHLTAPRAELALALAYGRNPPRTALYRDPEVAARAPFISALLPILERARPRPVTPYYNLLSDTLQSELSAAVSGIRSPAEALERSQRAADRITLGERR